MRAQIWTFRLRPVEPAAITSGSTGVGKAQNHANHIKEETHMKATKYAGTQTEKNLEAAFAGLSLIHI